MNIKFVFYLTIGAFLTNMNSEEVFEHQSLNEQKSSWEKEVSSLVTKIDNNLYLLKKHPTYAVYQNEALFAYNTLRELFNKQPVKSLKDIDEPWLNELGYKFWKKKNFVDTPLRLWLQTWELKQTLKRLDKYPETFTIQPEKLYSYNALREKMNLPPALSRKDIDENWLEAQSYAFWKQHKQESTKKWSESQETLIKSLIADINQDVSVLRNSPYPLTKEAVALKEEEIVYAYNLLKELVGGPKAITSWEQIDLADLANVNAPATRGSVLSTLKQAAPWIEMLAVGVIVARLAERMHFKSLHPALVK